MTKLTRILTLACIITTFTMHGMNECDQNNQAMITLNTFLMLLDTPKATYATSKLHELLRKDHNIHSTTLKDPLLHVVMKDQNSDFTYRTMLPAKQLVFCDNNSKIQLQDNVNNFFINAQYKPNPNLPEKTSHKQFTRIMEEFFADPTISPDNGKQELQDAGIVVQQTIPGIIVSSAGNMGTVETPFTIEFLSHGPNGSTSEKDLLRSLLHENVPSNINVVSALAQRERTGYFK